MNSSLFLTTKTLQSFQRFAWKGLGQRLTGRINERSVELLCKQPFAVCASLAIKDSADHKGFRFTAVQLNNKSATACTLDLLLSWSYDYFIDCVFILI